MAEVAASSSSEASAVLDSRVSVPDQCPSGSKPSGKGCIDVKPVYIEERCPSVQKALRFYTKRWQHWTARSGAVKVAGPSARPSSNCPRYLVHIRQRKAVAAHKAYERWSYQYEWERWLPQPYRAIFQCETPIGNEGINWQHHAGAYEGGPGFWYGTWDGYKPQGAPKAAYLASPRQQYQAALNVASDVGLGAWGCYTHGGYKYHL